MSLESVSSECIKLTGETNEKGPVAGNGSERLSNGLGSMVMGTSHEVLRYMGFGQKSLGAVLGPKEQISEISPIENLHL